MPGISALALPTWQIGLGTVLGPVCKAINPTKLSTFTSMGPVEGTRAFLAMKLPGAESRHRPTPKGLARKTKDKTDC